MTAVTRLPLTAALAALALAACARSPRPSSDDAPSNLPVYTGAPKIPPLGTYAGQHVAVLPVQAVRRDDPLGWGERLVNATGGDAAVVLASLDSALAASLRSRGLGTTWLSAEAVARAAKRNPTYAPDPRALALAQLAQAERRPDIPIDEPLAGQLRTLAGLSDARFLLLPIRLRFERRQDDKKITGRATLDVAMLDARLAQLLWRGAVTTDFAANLQPDWATTLAQRVADLAVGR